MITKGAIGHVLTAAKAVRNEPLAAQLKIDVSQARLILVQRHERDLGLNRHRLRQLRFPSAEHRELAFFFWTLIEVLDHRNHIEPASLQGDGFLPPEWAPRSTSNRPTSPGPVSKGRLLIPDARQMLSEYSAPSPTAYGK